MSETKPAKRERIVSPTGTATFIAIDRPTKKYDSFTVSIILEEKDGKPLFENLQKRADEIKAKIVATAKNGKEKIELQKLEACSPIKLHIDDDGNPTGRYILSASQGATMKLKDGTVKPMKVPIFDSKKAVISGATNAGKGTRCRLAIDIDTYDVPKGGRVGVKGYLTGVQIIELVKYDGSASADALGFGSVDGGFEAGGEEEGAPFDAGSAPAASGGAKSGTDF